MTLLILLIASFVAQTMAQNCSSCQQSSLNINTAGQGDPGLMSHNPVVAVGKSQGGCSTLTVTCTPQSPGMPSLMTFQNGLGGPAPGNPVTATLVCNSKNEWTFSMGGETMAITAVYCSG